MLLPLVSMLSLCRAPLGTEALQLCRRTQVQDCVPEKSSRVRSAKKNDSDSCTWFHSDKQASVKRAYSAWQQVSIVQKSLAGSQKPTPVYLLRNPTQTPKAAMIVHRQERHLPWINWCAYPSNHTQLEQNCSCLIFVQGRQLIQNREDVWKSMQDV